jgi:hypothetical protein
MENSEYRSALEEAGFELPVPREKDLNLTRYPTAELRAYLSNAETRLADVVMQAEGSRPQSVKLIGDKMSAGSTATGRQLRAAGPRHC